MPKIRRFSYSGTSKNKNICLIFKKTWGREKAWSKKKSKNMGEFENKRSILGANVENRLEDGLKRGWAEGILDNITRGDILNNLPYKKLAD